MKKFAKLITAGLLALLVFAACGTNDADVDADFGAFAEYSAAIRMTNLLPGDFGAVDASVQVTGQIEFDDGTTQNNDQERTLRIIANGDDFRLRSAHMSGELFALDAAIDIIGGEAVRAEMVWNTGDVSNFLEDEGDIDIGQLILSQGLHFNLVEIAESWLISATTEIVGGQTHIDLLFEGRGLLDAMIRMAEGVGAEYLEEGLDHITIEDYRVKLVLGEDGLPRTMTTYMESRAAEGVGEDVGFAVASNRFHVVFNAFGSDVIIE
ncbi:MAG: hypothetical protein LBE35_08025 [Clostridiales bacterium]|jgi:hypothetical protein|nr:hypothetical protein [Clostridiales bacterium]